MELRADLFDISKICVFHVFLLYTWEMPEKLVETTVRCNLGVIISLKILHRSITK